MTNNQSLTMKVTLVSKEQNKELTITLPCENLEDVIESYFGTNEVTIKITKATCKLWTNLANVWENEEIDGNFFEMNDCMVRINDDLQANVKLLPLLKQWVANETNCNLDDVLSSFKRQDLINK